MFFTLMLFVNSDLFEPVCPVCGSAGLCQLVNKMDEASGSVKAFNRNDEQFLEAFAVFCGLGIQNTQMYETVERAMAKQEVTLEVSYTHTHILDSNETLFLAQMSPCAICLYKESIRILVTSRILKDF